MNRPSSPSRPWPRVRWALWLSPILLAFGPDSPAGQGRPGGDLISWNPPTSLFDPRLDPLRQASAHWEVRQGPDRVVVDQVCLVPDLPTYLDAIATWDQSHYFPILFDDVESTARFLRAFRPSRVIRMLKGGNAAQEPPSWERGLKAVASAWREGREPRSELVANGVAPRDLGATPPGVVITSPRAPMLAGAVALAAGRFQAMVKLDYPRRYADILDPEEIRDFSGRIEAAVAEVAPDHSGLGDACDFLTVAGDWPYRYRDARGEMMATDDAIGRRDDDARRWAFAGRLMGDPAESAYRAMCSLFLPPDSAAMFNGYDETATPWSTYAMRAAAARLGSTLPTTQVSGQSMGSVEGWHETFDPWNQRRLVMINSHGTPTVFHMRGDPATTVDVPRTAPAAVVMIHSFSAADPADPATIAGRWLRRGAFVYFGSMNEPYLQAFRTPQLVADLIVERLPLIAAVKSIDVDPFGKPWRLVYLGDPLYRLKPRMKAEPRIPTWEPTAAWPAYVVAPVPVDGSAEDRFAWALKATLARAQVGREKPPDDVADVLLGIDRDALPEPTRSMFDALIADVLFHANRRSELRGWIAAIPVSRRSSTLRGWQESLLMIDLPLAVARKDFARSRSLWADLMSLPLPHEAKQHATGLVARLADTLTRRLDWAEQIRAILRNQPYPRDAEILQAELRRLIPPR